MEDWGAYSIDLLGPVVSFPFSLGLCVPIYKSTWFSEVISLVNFQFLYTTVILSNVELI